MYWIQSECCREVPSTISDIFPRRRVVFVDTDQVPAKESRVGDLVQNETEASLVQQLVKAMVRGGVEESQVGVISLYRQQIKIMSQLLESHRGVEILTADRSQGRDKDCIIISMVRSNDSDSIGDLLKDWRRLNVSFTRARSKLVIFGSRRTLDNTKLLQNFFELMAENNWIYKLRKGADTSHDVKPQTVFKKALKRSAAEMEKENDVIVPLSQSPRKRLRIDKSAGAKASALFKGRAILKDVAMDIQPI
jgi:DNA replication ATP-dependent helicase Dna2